LRTQVDEGARTASSFVEGRILGTAVAPKEFDQLELDEMYWFGINLTFLMGGCPPSWVEPKSRGFGRALEMLTKHGAEVVIAAIKANMKRWLITPRSTKEAWLQEAYSRLQSFGGRGSGLAEIFRRVLEDLPIAPDWDDRNSELRRGQLKPETPASHETPHRERRNCCDPVAQKNNNLA